MPVRVKCACGATLSIADEHMGKTIKCPKCEKTFKLPERVLPEKAQAVEEPEASDGHEEQKEPEEEQAPVPIRPRRRVSRVSAARRRAKERLAEARGETDDEPVAPKRAATARARTAPKGPVKPKKLGTVATLRLIVALLALPGIIYVFVMAVALSSADRGKLRADIEARWEANGLSVEDDAAQLEGAIDIAAKAATTVGTLCWIAFALWLPMAILEGITAIGLMQKKPSFVPSAKAIAVVECFAVFGLSNLIVGIISLVLLSDPEVKEYISGSNPSARRSARRRTSREKLDKDGGDDTKKDRPRRRPSSSRLRRRRLR